MTDDLPVVDLEDDVHALPAQPAPLVEAVRRPARQTHDDEGIHECALRRRPAERQLELDALADRPSFETVDAGRDAQLERTRARIAGDLEERASAAIDVGEQRAPVERVEPDGSPGPAERGRRRPRRRRPCAGAEASTSRDDGDRGGHDDVERAL